MQARGRLEIARHSKSEVEYTNALLARHRPALRDIFGGSVDQTKLAECNILGSCKRADVA